MQIDILCTDLRHPVRPWLTKWIKEQSSSHEISLLSDKSQLSEADLLFLISCPEIIPLENLSNYNHTAVIHSSDLPEGRGWSPHVWSILSGAEEVVVSALEAEQKVDTGRIWAKRKIEIPPHALYSEINAMLFMTWTVMMTDVCSMILAGIEPQEQPQIPATYWPRRSPADSELDPHETILSQFNLLRICDPERYPAFFQLHGHTYVVNLKKVEGNE